MSRPPSLDAGATSPADVDWDEWRLALDRFATATGLAVSAYDAMAERRAGPFVASKVACLLADAGVFDSGRAGALAERALVTTAVATGAPVHEALLDELHVRAMPLSLDGRVVGAVTFGWVFGAFGTALGCERLARHLSVDGARLWAEARLESPVSATRMQVYHDLLQTLVASASRHAEAIGRLAELGRMREVFLAQVSHELRTPLTVLANRIELLLRTGLDDPEKIKAALSKMKRHVAEEVRLVEDLIDTARSRTGQLTIDPQPASLIEILRAALAAVLPNAEAKGVRVDASSLDGDRPWPIIADRVRLQQVFWNLLSNAVKFTQPGGTIAIDMAEPQSLYVVTITDTGRGIEPEMLPRIFDTFTRQRGGNEQGLGLGLSIAAVLVEAHGGHIDAQSPGVGKGATFRVALPR